MLKNPKLAYKRAKDYDYTESFGYAIPGEDEGHLIDQDCYNVLADQYISAIKKAKTDNAEVKAAIGEVLEALEGVKKGFPSKSPYGSNSLHESLNLLRTAEVITHWGPDNCINDYRVYMG